MFQLEEAIVGWRRSLRRRGRIRKARIAELEDHLRCEIEERLANGQSAEDAFQDASRQLGDTRQLAKAYAVNAGWAGRMWQRIKQNHYTNGGCMSRRMKSAMIILNALFFAAVILLSKWYWMNDGFSSTTLFLIIAVWFGAHVALTDRQAKSLRSEIRCLRNMLLSTRNS